MFKLTPARAVAVGIARDYLKMSPFLQRVFFGDNYQRTIDKLAVMIAAYDYAVATRSALIALPSVPSPVALLAVPDEDSWLADVAPSMEFVLGLLFEYSRYDVDSLDTSDRADFEKEIAWAEFWYQWHARQLDA